MEANTQHTWAEYFKVLRKEEEPIQQVREASCICY